MANDRMYLVHRPTGRRAYLARVGGFSREWAANDTALDELRKFFEVVNGEEEAPWSIDFGIELETDRD